MCEPTFDRSVPEGPEGSPLSARLLAPAPVDQASRGRMLLENHFALIQQRLKSLSRHSGLPDHQTDEFLSWALFKLVENNYRILTLWEGRSSFSTYLIVVLVHLMRDYRNTVANTPRGSAGHFQETSEPTPPRTRRTRSACR